MLKFHVTIECTNETFHPRPQDEIAAILQELIETLMDSGYTQSIPLRDNNGNWVGTARFTVNDGKEQDNG